MTARPSTAAPILAVLAIVLPMALYVGGYFWMGLRSDGYEGYSGAVPVFSIRPIPGGKPVIARQYRYRWPTIAFQPLAYLESALTGTEVSLTVCDF